MVEDDRYCVEILQQIQAVKAALAGVESLVLKQHAAHCVEGAIESGDPLEQRQKFSELIDLLERVHR
jgi:DNA-binding FrmR family transcriptional regulator